MNIYDLGTCVDAMEDGKIAEILTLIISAIEDYPIVGLVDTDIYFSEIAKKLNEDISPIALDKYVNSISCSPDENNVWIAASLNGMLIAFDLMKMYGISFEDVKKIISSAE